MWKLKTAQASEKLKAKNSELTKGFRVGEDSTTVFVEPVVIATVEYIQTYPDTRNKVYRIENWQVREIGGTTLVRLRNPHVEGYRADK